MYMPVFLAALLLPVAAEEKQEETIPLTNKSSGMDVVLVMDHSVSIRVHEEALRARDTSARAAVSLCGGVGSTMGVVYFSGGFLPEDSAAYLPRAEGDGEIIEELVEKERKIRAAYPENREDSQSGGLADLNKLQERRMLLEEQIGVLSERVNSTDTNLAVGLNRAVELLRSGKNEEKAIILFSDGHNDTKDDNEELEYVYDEETKRIVEIARENQIKIFVVYLDEYNPKQADEEKLREIVNYYGKEDNEETRFKRVGSTADLEREFLSVMNEVSNVGFQAKPVVSSGVYTLSDLPRVDVQSVLLMFRGDGVEIQRVEKDGERLDNEDCYYNFEAGADSISLLYFDSIDPESTCKIVTNGREEQCYEIYSSSLRIQVREEKDRLSVGLYRKNGKQVEPDTEMRMDIDWVEPDTGVGTSMVRQLAPEGDFFVLRDVELPAGDSGGYQITLYGKESRILGRCIWPGEQVRSEAEASPRAALKEGPFWVTLEMRLVSGTVVCSGKVKLSELCNDPEEDYEGLEVKVYSRKGTELDWRMDREAGALEIPANKKWPKKILPATAETVILQLKRDGQLEDEKQVLFMLYDKFPSERYRYIGFLLALVLSFFPMRKRIKKSNRERLESLKKTLPEKRKQVEDHMAQMGKLRSWKGTEVDQDEMRHNLFNEFADKLQSYEKNYGQADIAAKLSKIENEVREIMEVPEGRFMKRRERIKKLWKQLNQVKGELDQQICASRELDQLYKSIH